MKTPKLIAIFVGVLVAIVCAVLLGGGGGGSDRSTGGKSAGHYDKAEAKIEKEWQSAEDWSVENFEKMSDWLSLRKKDLHEGYGTLVTKFHNRALDCLYEKTVNTFAMTTCSKAAADAMRSALSVFLESAPEQKEEGKVKTMNGIHSVYSRAYSLAAASVEDFVRSPEFSRSKGSWYDYDSYRKKEIKLRDAVKSDPSYGYIKNISFISSGLDALDGKLDSAEEKFREKLVTEIISAYQIDVPMIPGRLSEMTRLKEIPVDDKPEYERILKDAKKTLEERGASFGEFYNLLLKFGPDWAENSRLSSFTDEFSEALIDYGHTLEAAEKALRSSRLVLNY